MVDRNRSKRQRRRGNRSSGRSVDSKASEIVHLRRGPVWIIENPFTPEESYRLQTEEEARLAQAKKEAQAKNPDPNAQYFWEIDREKGIVTIGVGPPPPKKKR